jgi:hypothetical protein
MLALSDTALAYVAIAASAVAPNADVRPGRLQPATA